MLYWIAFITHIYPTLDSLMAETVSFPSKKNFSTTPFGGGISTTGRGTSFSFFILLVYTWIRTDGQVRFYNEGPETVARWNVCPSRRGLISHSRFFLRDFKNSFLILSFEYTATKWDNMSSSEFHLVITDWISIFPVALCRRVYNDPVCLAHVTTYFTFWTMSFMRPHDSTAFPTVRCIRWAMHQYRCHCRCQAAAFILLAPSVDNHFTLTGR